MKSVILLLPMFFGLSAQAANPLCFANITKTTDGIERVTPYTLELKDLGEKGYTAIGATLEVEDMKLEVYQIVAPSASDLQLKIYKKNNVITDTRIGRLEPGNTIQTEGSTKNLKAALSCLGK